MRLAGRAMKINETLPPRAGEKRAFWRSFASWDHLIYLFFFVSLLLNKGSWASRWSLLVGERHHAGANFVTFFI